MLHHPACLGFTDMSIKPRLHRHGNQFSKEYPYLTHSVAEVVFQKSIPTQIRQFIFNISNNKGHVDGFVWELTPAHRL